MDFDSINPPAGTEINVRRGQVTEKLSRAIFRERFTARFCDPAFRKEEDALNRLEIIAWEAYEQSRKSPVTAKTGVGYADPDYDLSVEWRDASERIKASEARQRDPAMLSRVLIVSGSSRNDFTCPSEMSKSFRLAQLAQTTLEGEALVVDTLDLSRLNSDRDLHICKGCVSTAMTLCHWPCSCYPNDSSG